MRDEEVEAMLAMAERSAQGVAPDALEDLPEYAAALRSAKDLSRPHPSSEDAAAAKFMDGLFVEIGMGLLLQIAKELLAELRKKAVQEGATSIWNYLESKMAHGAPESEAASQAAQAVASEVANEIVLKVKVPSGIEVSQVQVAITLQVQALLEREPLTRALPA